jgi:hypothetical protein
MVDAGIRVPARAKPEPLALALALRSAPREGERKGKRKGKGKGEICALR